MNNLAKFEDQITIDQVQGYDNDYLKMLLDYYADQNDIAIEHNLVSELMARYAALSRELDDKNRLLEMYNHHLEELVQKKVAEITRAQVATIHALVKAAEVRDNETGAHIERTSQYCRLLAEKIMLTPKYEHLDRMYPTNIEMAAPLHDIGKVGITDLILLKPGKLTEQEFEIMKTHTLIGYNTLKSVDEMYPGNDWIKIGMDIALNHHEKWDGSGYRSGLQGEEIPLAGRIMALSDVYDALRAKRVYKPPFSHEKAMGIMLEGRGTHFDPFLFDVVTEYQYEFKNIFEELTLKIEGVDALTPN